MTTKKEITKRILIISTNAIGDAYLSLSAVTPLKNKYGNIKFTFVFPKRSEVLQFDDNNDHKFIYSGKSVLNFISILGKLIFKKFDLAFSFFPGRYNTILLRLCNSKNKAGYYNYKKFDRWDNKSWVPLIKFENKLSTGTEWNDDKNYLKLITNVLESFIDENTIEKYKPIQIEKPPKIIDKAIIHGKSRTSDRSLTISQFGLVIDFLNDLGFNKIYILGNQSDNKRIKDYLNHKKVFYLSNLNLDELVKELNNSFFIGIDSFPIHIADAYDTNFVGLFTSTNPRSVLVNSSKNYIFNRKSFVEIPEKEFKAALKEIRIN